MEIKDSGKALLVLGAAVAGLFLITKASAAPTEYTCSYCGEKFPTLQELQAHVETVHPGERIPIEVIWS